MTQNKGNSVVSGALVALVVIVGFYFFMKALIDQRNAAPRIAVTESSEVTPTPTPTPEPTPEDEYGEPPTFIESPYDGSLTIPRAVTRSIKSVLKDPDSFQPRKAVSMSKDERDGVKCWKIEFIYAAKNSFGGYGTKGARAWLRGSQLIAIEDANF